MPDESKKHHYNPRYLLRNFSIEGDGQQVWVLDKTKGRSWVSSVTNAGSENYFNQFEFRGESYNFEDLFQRVDGSGAEVIRKILDEGTIGCLSCEELDSLSFMAAVQLLRTKYPRVTMIELVTQLANRQRELGFSDEELKEQLEFGDNEARIAAFRGLLNADRVATLLRSKLPVLLTVPKGLRLYTSDNPLVMNNSFKFGQMGLNSKGIEIYLPIAPDYCLHFLCPSYYFQLKEGYDPDHPRPSLKNPWFGELFKGMKHGTPVAIDSGMSTFLNELQIAYSDRFVFSSDGWFEPAREYLEARPEHRDGRWRHRVGEIGEVVPPAVEDAPGGEVVVFRGRTNYFEMRVASVVPESVAFRFVTSDGAKLQAVENDCPLSRVEYYVDGHLQQSLSDATIERIPLADSEGRILARVKYIDQRLNQLFEGPGRGVKHQLRASAQARRSSQAVPRQCAGDGAK